MGVGDQIAVAIETEFNGPPMAKDPNADAAKTE